jgi:glycosyltransferase involved in cell wall biosynthesis
MNTAEFDISVIVATFNRAHSLARLLKSFDSLEMMDCIRLELLVVDNGSTDRTQSVVFAKKGNSLKYDLKLYCEARRGQSVAINLGLQNCSGRIICLVDDDVTLDPKWLRGLVASYEASDFDALQGRILPGVDPHGRSADPSKLFYYNIPIVDYGNEIKPIRGLTGAHMTFKRSVYEQIGGFNANLGPGASGFSGDTEYSRRIRAAGFKIGFTPHAMVYHELSPLRYGRGYNRRVHYRKGLSRSVYREDSITFSILPNLLFNSCRLLFYWVVRRNDKIYRIEGRICRFLGHLCGSVQRRVDKSHTQAQDKPVSNSPTR